MRPAASEFVWLGQPLIGRPAPQKWPLLFVSLVRSSAKSVRELAANQSDLLRASRCELKICDTCSAAAAADMQQPPALQTGRATGEWTVGVLLATAQMPIVPLRSAASAEQPGGGRAGANCECRVAVVVARLPVNQLRAFRSPLAHSPGRPASRRTGAGATASAGFWSRAASSELPANWRTSELANWRTGELHER